MKESMDMKHKMAELTLKRKKEELFEKTKEKINLQINIQNIRK